jgi:hypothetical protein
MTTLDQLRQAMEERAALAPDGAGLVQAAQAGAARIRRRRRITGMTVAAGLTLAIAAGTPAVLQWRATPPPVAPAVPDRTRTAGEMTLTIDPAARAAVDRYGASSSGQFQSVAITTPAGKRYDADVYAYAPGTPDQAIPGPVETAVVQGRPAQYRKHPGSESLTWRDPGGSLVSVDHRYLRQSDAAVRRPPGVHDGPDRAALQTIADAVRIGPPREITAPIRFGTLRDGLRMSGITVSVADPARPIVTVTLEYPGSTANDRRQVDVITMAGSGSGRGRAPVAAVGGHPAWYGPYGDNKRRNSLMLDAGPCRVDFITSPGMTEQQVRDLAGGARLIPCDQMASWVPPVG